MMFHAMVLVFDVVWCGWGWVVVDVMAMVRQNSNSLLFQITLFAS